MITTEIVQSTTKKGQKAQLTCIGEELVFSIGDDEYKLNINIVSKKIQKHFIKQTGQ